MIFRAAIAGKVLDADNPIDLTNPLNIGLISDWSAIIPYFYGGNAYRDLSFHKTRRNPLTLSGPLWGGFAGSQLEGCLTFDGTDDVITGGVPEVNPMTICFWYYAPSTIAGFSAPIIQGDDSFDSNVWDWGMYSSDASTLILYPLQGGTTMSVTMNAGAWNFIMMMRKRASDTNAVAWVNGLYQTEVGTATSRTNSRAVRTMSGVPNEGKLGSIRLYSTEFTDAMVAQLYEDYVSGEYKRLNWLSTRTFFGTAAAPAAGGFNAAWALNSNNLIGGGVI